MHRFNYVQWMIFISGRSSIQNDCFYLNTRYPSNLGYYGSLVAENNMHPTWVEELLTPLAGAVSDGCQNIFWGEPPPVGRAVSCWRLFQASDLLLSQLLCVSVKARNSSTLERETLLNKRLNTASLAARIRKTVPCGDTGND